MVEQPVVVDDGSNLEARIVRWWRDVVAPIADPVLHKFMCNTQQYTACLHLTNQHFTTLDRQVLTSCDHIWDELGPKHFDLANRNSHASGSEGLGHTGSYNRTAMSSPMACNRCLGVGHALSDSFCQACFEALLTHYIVHCSLLWIVAWVVGQVFGAVDPAIVSDEGLDLAVVQLVLDTAHHDDMPTLRHDAAWLGLLCRDKTTDPESSQ